MNRLALLLVACLTACSKSPTVSPTPAGESQGTYQGKVMSEDGQPISGTAVFLDVIQWVPIEVEIVDGRYTATLPGTYWIGVKASGYEGHIVQDGKAVLQKALPPVAISHPSPPDEIDELDDEPVISEKPLQDPYENPTSLILGDVTGDNQVSEEDLRAVFEYLLGGNEPSLIKLGDVDGNGTVDWEDIRLLGQYVSSGTGDHGIGERIQLPTASLSPDPSSTVFAADGTWTTYRVQTSADSVLVVVNTGNDDTILEIAGGSRAPSRSYCGAERNDRPSRARRNRWNLHISACGDGQSTIQIKDYRFETTLASYSVTVGQQESGAPDLVIEEVRVSEPNPTPGQSLELSVTLSNKGTSDAESTTLRYYRSSNQTISSRDAEINTQSVAALSAADSRDMKIEFAAPSTEGTYYYGACVVNVSDESDTDNNCSTGVRVTVEARSPDLIVASASVSDSTRTPGQSFTLKATVRNQGTGRSASTTLRYFRSTDATISTGDTEVGTDGVGALAVSGSSAESISLTAPSSEGTYFYGACVVSVAGESNTGNNCSSAVTVTVTDDGEDAVHLGDCQVGMKLQSGESCNYYSDGYTVRFSVSADGSSCRASDKTVTREVFGVQVEVGIDEVCVSHDIEGDDVYDEPNFSADNNSDGSWTIKAIP